VSEKIKVSLEKKKNLDEPLVGYYVVNMAKKVKVSIAGESCNQGNFAGFVPTSWAPCCKTWLKLKS
jgi:hypothetical protein